VLIGLLKDTVEEFLHDDCPTMAAALSYYTVFSLPPLLLLLLMLLGSVVDPGEVQGAIRTQINNLMGSGAADQIRTILESAHRPGSTGVVSTVVGVVALLLGASGAFGQLQTALNRAWGVAPDPARGGLKSFIVKRVFSFGMVLAVGFLLLVSLVVSAALVAFGDAVSAVVPGGLSEPVLQALNLAVSLIVIGLVFAAIFKVLPDATIAWRDVWIGALATALLFVIGKFLIGFYLGRTNPGEAFGAASSLAILLIWIYYSSMIVLLGAEFTQQWAERRGSGIRPEQGAVRTVHETHPVRGAAAT
jgi:membrane protein